MMQGKTPLSYLRIPNTHSLQTICNRVQSITRRHHRLARQLANNNNNTINAMSFR